MMQKASIWSRLLAPGALHYLLASGAFVAVFAIIPFSLYLHSGQEWALAPDLLLRLAGLGVPAFLGMALLLRLLAALSQRTAIAVSIGLFCLGVFVLLAHVYAPVAIGPLDGDAIRSDEPTLYTIIEAVLLIGAIALFVCLWRGRGLGIAGALAGGLWLVAIGYGIAAFWPTQGTAVAAEASAIPEPTSCGAKGNVYQIVLDSLETEAFLKVVEENAWADRFPGFDLFANNISNYIVTKNSMPSYLSGTFYHSGDLVHWRDTSGGVLLEDMRRRDFGLWEYAPFDHWNNKSVDLFQTNMHVYRERVDVLEGDLYDFLTVWMLSLVPNTETKEAVSPARHLADITFAALTTGWRADEVVEKQDPRWQNRVSKSDFHRYASVLLLEQMLQDETLRTQTCHYVYAHAVIPHSPFVLDGRCRYVGEGRQRSREVGTRAAYLQQTECSVRKVIAFLRELKQLGRYDAATILLHADTGDWLHISGKQDDQVLGFQRAKLLGKVRALLMIKKPGSRRPLEIVDTPTQLVDIYPTLLDILDVEEPPGLHGRSVYGPATPPRDARFALNPEDQYGPDLIEVRIDDATDLATSTLTVLGPATDPSVWRTEIKRANQSHSARSKHDASRATTPAAAQR